MKAMELRVAKRVHMSAVGSLGLVIMLRRSSSSLDRRSTIRRHGTRKNVSGMSHTPRSTTSISLGGCFCNCKSLGGESSDFQLFFRGAGYDLRGELYKLIPGGGASCCLLYIVEAYFTALVLLLSY